MSGCIGTCWTFFGDGTDLHNGCGANTGSTKCLASVTGDAELMQQQPKNVQMAQESATVIGESFGSTVVGYCQAHLNRSASADSFPLGVICSQLTSVSEYTNDSTMS